MRHLDCISAKLSARPDWVVMVLPEDEATQPSYIVPNTAVHSFSDMKGGVLELMLTRHQFMIAHRKVPAARVKTGLKLVAGDDLIALTCHGGRDPHTQELKPEVRAVLDRLDSYAEVGQNEEDVTVVLQGAIAPVDICVAGPWSLLNANAVILLTGHRLEGYPEDPQPRAAEVTKFWQELTGKELAPTGEEFVPTADAPRPEAPAEKVDETRARRDPRESVVTATIELVYDLGGQLIVDQQNVPYLTMPIGDHVEYHRLPSQTAEKLLRRTAYHHLKKPLNQQNTKDVMALLATLAEEEGPQMVVGTRVIHHAGITYLALGDAHRTIIEVSAYGWKAIDEADCPVCFLRPRNLAALPYPVPGGTVLDLQKVLNVAWRDLVLIVAWLVGALSGIHPYPLLVVNGEAGAGKSHGTRAIRDLVDPRAADLRSLSRNEQDLVIAAQNQHVLAYDNVSSISPELSDSLCRLATGGSFATRTLFSTDEETILTACNPVVLNGIPELLSQPDLADRAILITLQRITDEQRRPEREVKAAYDLLQPSILGALLDALAAGLKNRDQVQLKSLPRMADFAQLAVAAEQACPWPAGTFMATYADVQNAAAGSLLDGNEFASTLQRLVEETGHWTGNYQALLSQLGHRYLAVRGHSLPRGWPANAKAAASAVRRAAPALRQLGIEVEYGGRTAAGATVTFALAAGSQPVAPTPQGTAAVGQRGVVVGEV